jgi:uncharacterized membrane protein YfcA
MVWTLCLCIGLCSGFLAGLLGVGGGIVIVPALILGAHRLGIGADDAAPVAMATALAIVIPTSISSARAHAAREAIDWYAFRCLAPGIAAGALAGTLAVCSVGAPLGGRLALAAFIGFALLAAYRMLAPVSATGEPDPAAALLRLTTLRPHSVAVGLLSALAGVGGGLLSVPLLARYIPMRRAIGTAAVLGLPLAVAGLSGYLLAGHPARCVAGCLGHVFLPAVLAISLAAVTTAPLGASLAHHLPAPLLKRSFAALLLLVSADLSAELFR